MATTTVCSTELWPNNICCIKYLYFLCNWIVIGSVGSVTTSPVHRTGFLEGNEYHRYYGVGPRY